MSPYEQTTKAIVRDCKTRYFENPRAYDLPIVHLGQPVGRLRPVPIELRAEAARDAEFQTVWRNLHKETFFVAPFTATVARTSEWLKNTYNHNDDVLIFMIEDGQNRPVGHLGLSCFDYEQRVCEYGRLLRGSFSPWEISRRVNLLELAAKTMMEWAFGVVGLSLIYARVLADNRIAIELNKKCGMKITDRMKVEAWNGLRDVVRMEVTPAATRKSIL